MNKVLAVVSIFSLGGGNVLGAQAAVANPADVGTITDIIDGKPAQSMVSG